MAQNLPPRSRGVLVAAVVADTAPLVLREATDLAAALGTEVLAVHVDPSRRVVARHPDGTVDSVPIDPDADDQPDTRAADTLRQLVESRADSSATVTLVTTAGDPAEEIARLAEHVHARMIVVGTRKPGLAHHVAEFFTGSVAAQLAHQQPRPVLVIPTTPGSFKDPAPWDG